jgi:hypothetical protein
MALSISKPTPVLGVRAQQQLLQEAAPTLLQPPRARSLARPRFVIVNAIALTLAAAAWQAGWLDGLAALSNAEWAMLAFLMIYFGVGLAAAFRRDWKLVGHIANGLPMWALGFTGLGLVMAVSGLKAMTPETLLTVFRHLALAIVPNVFGVLLMVWLREIAFWSGDREETDQ